MARAGLNVRSEVIAVPELPSGTVTFLLTDIEGSTSLVQRLGDRYGRLLGDHRRLLRAAVEEADGVEVDCRADEFFGAFADAKDAVRAAVSAERALQLHKWPDELQLAVRIGIHTGEPTLADEGYLGLDVHRAARICSAANGGQVLVSGPTRESLSDPDLSGIGFRDLGEHHLKGLSRPERIFQVVVDDLQSEFRPLRDADTGAVEPGPFAGRERELAQTAVGRLRQALSGLREAGRAAPDLEELGWEVRALLPAALPADQRQLAELGGALFTSGRSVVEADRYLASFDRDSMERQLREYRDMGVVSKRAAGEVEALASRIAHIDRLAARRKSVEETTSELAAGIRSLSERIQHGRASTTPDLSSETAALRVRAQAADLEGALATARSQLGLMDLRLRRTRSRGVFRHGERYVVPYYDEVGVEHRKEFQTRGEARSFQWAVRFAQKQRREYAGPSFKGHEWTGGGGGG
jgi:class 3 adenylate cyclase